MTVRHAIRRFLVLGLIAALTLTGCSLGDRKEPPCAAAEFGSANDINPQDPASLQDGGNLTLALTEYPVNFNPLHIDGNTVDTGSLMRPTMPRAFTIKPDGSTTVNTDYFTSIELTSSYPQVITYTINPKATWTDGAPITWQDIDSQIRATNKTDEAFAIAAPNGSERVGLVTRGVDDRQAVITFAKPYAEWRGMFAGNSQLLPRSMTADPEVFNNGQLNGPGPSAGPFVVTNLDKTAKRITLTRNPKWWGQRPRLDAITFLQLDDAARLPALQNNAIDSMGIGTLEELIIAQGTKGISIRCALGASWYHFTFNGAPGSILADRELRLAIAKAIDRQAIVKVVQNGLVKDPASLNNHIYVAGQQGYQDNSAVVAYDPEKARRELDQLGWKQNGEFREKDGRQLVIRNVLFDAKSTRVYAQIAQKNLAEVGVKLELDVKPGGGFFSQYIIPGDFDIAQFGWGGDAFPLSGLTQIYASAGESNFGKIGSPQIDAKIEQTLAELNPANARTLANELDVMIWQEGFSLPLTQSVGNVAVRDNLANYGPAGLGDLDYTAIGFTK